MNTLAERLNFSDTKADGSIEVKKWHDVNFYETLCLYCADNEIDLSSVSDDDFDGAVIVMEDYGQADKQNETYFFWIDGE